MTPTHEEWEAARDRRNRAALQSVRHLLAGNTAAAMSSAREAAAADDEMDRIGDVLDAGL